MRDWRKFAWKKGDVLVGKYNVYIIFEGFTEDTYTRFEGRHYLCKECGGEDYSKKEVQMLTSFFKKANDDEAQTYINTIEERLGGKLNREALEVEKTQPEFKDGDIVTQGVLKGVNVCIIKNCIDKFDNKYNYYARYNTQDKEINYDDWSHISPFAKFATDYEKQQLFDALAKENKAWDAEEKQIVDLKHKCEFKPFDKVLVKDNPYGSWEPALFWKKVDVKDLHPYKIIGGKRYRYCEPYEGNEHLLDN